jgi:hypothetical protein
MQIQSDSPIASSTETYGIHIAVMQGYRQVQPDLLEKGKPHRKGGTQSHWPDFFNEGKSGSRVTEGKRLRPSVVPPIVWKKYTTEDL